jgi:adenine-specific DNA-methyltransferase
MAKRKSANSSVDSLKHKDKRKNIPTAELQDFVKEDEAKPKKILYPRDPSLDLQLEWTGKAENTFFEVPTVSLHIHERIAPE